MEKNQQSVFIPNCHKKREAALSQGCLAISKSLIKNIACFVKASIL